MLHFYLNVTHKSQQRDKKTLEQARKICLKIFSMTLKVLDAMTDITIRNCIKGVVNFQLSDNLDNQNTNIYYYHGTKSMNSCEKISTFYIEAL